MSEGISLSRGGRAYVGGVVVAAGTGVAVAVTAGGAGGGVDAAAGGGGRVGAGVAAAIRSAVVVAAPGVTDGGASPPLVQADARTRAPRSSAAGRAAPSARRWGDPVASGPASSLSETWRHIVLRVKTAA